MISHAMYFPTSFPGKHRRSAEKEGKTDESIKVKKTAVKKDKAKVGSKRQFLPHPASSLYHGG